MLVDTPGLRETEDAIEREAILQVESRLIARSGSDVLDVTQPPTDVPFDQTPVIRVLNKCDLPAKVAAGPNDVKVWANPAVGSPSSSNGSANVLAAHRWMSHNRDAGPIGSATG